MLLEIVILSNTFWGNNTVTLETLFCSQVFCLCLKIMAMEVIQSCIGLRYVHYRNQLVKCFHGDLRTHCHLKAMIGL
jgi:hypothetical protein